MGVRVVHPPVCVCVRVCVRDYPSSNGCLRRNTIHSTCVPCLALPVCVRVCACVCVCVRVCVTWPCPGDLATPLAVTLWGSSAPSVWSSRQLVIFAFATLVVFPLSLLPKMSSLHGSSFLAVATVAGVAGVVIGYGLSAAARGEAYSTEKQCHGHDRHTHPAVWDWSILSAIPILGGSCCLNPDAAT